MKKRNKMKKKKHTFLNILVFMILKILEVGAALMLFVFISLLGKLICSLLEANIVTNITTEFGILSVTLYFLIGIVTILFTALIFMLILGIIKGFIIPFINWNWKQAKRIVKDWK